MDDILNKIKDELTEIKIDLREHMARTEAAEKRLDILERLADEIKILLPDVRRVLKWWPLVSGILVAIVVGKPELLSSVMNFLKAP